MCIFTSPPRDSEVGPSSGLIEIRLIAKSSLSVLPALYQRMVSEQEKAHNTITSSLRTWGIP